MAAIDQLTHAAVLDRDMRIPVSIFGQTLYITLGQLLAAQNTLTLAQYSEDGDNWHDEMGGKDKFTRISTDGGNTWGPAINIYDPDAQPAQGADGQSLYTWMKFADTDNPQTGADIYDTPRSTTTAIGWAYNKTTPQESTDPNDYEWTRFKGRDAVQSVEVTEHFAVGESSTLPPSLGWVEVPENAMPQMSAEKPYLWNYERTAYSDGTWRDTTPHVVGQMGADGNSITSVTDYYLAHKNAIGVRNTFAGWTDDIDDAQAQWGETLPFLWNYEERHWSNGGTDKTKPRVIARWAKDGKDGAKGKDGTSVTVDSTSVTYSTQRTSSQPADGTFTLTSVPTNLASGDYLWARTIVTFTDGKSTRTYAVSRIGVNGNPGKDGTSVSISSTSVTYAKNTTGSQPSDGDFTSTTVPSLGKGDYLWTKTVVTYSDGKSTKTYSVSRIGTDGANGQGTPGADGKTYYTHFAYSTSSNGAANFNTSPFDGATYIGICTDENVADPASYTAYKWSRYRGEDGLTPVYDKDKDNWEMVRNPNSTQLNATKVGLKDIQSKSATALSTAEEANKTAGDAATNAGEAKNAANNASNKATDALTTAQSKADASWKIVKNSDGTISLAKTGTSATPLWTHQSLSDYVKTSTLQSNVNTLQSAIDKKVTMAQVEEQGYVKVQNESGYHEVYLTIVKNSNNALDIQACGYQTRDNKDKGIGNCFLLDKGLSQSEVQALIDEAVASSSVSVVNSKPTLSWGATSTVGKVNGTALQVTMPANPVTSSAVMGAHTVRNLPGFATPVDDPKTYFISNVSTDSYGHVTGLSRAGIDLTQYVTKSGLSTTVNNAVLAALPSKWDWADISGAPDMSQYALKSSIPTINTLSAVTNLGWNGTSGQLATINTIAYWNGQYASGASNLRYCDRGRFGTMATATATDYLARSGGSMTNTNVVTNLNADLLDGYHENSFVRSWWTDSPGFDCSTYLNRTHIGFTYGNNAPFTGGFINISCNNYGFYLGTAYGHDNNLYYRRHGTATDGGMGSWQCLATQSWVNSNFYKSGSNVASATAASQLTTARTLWGQSFNGTANVSGDMTGVGSITASGELSTTSANGFRIKCNNYGAFLRNDGSHTYLLLTNSGDSGGTWNSLRPLSVNNANGNILIGNSAMFVLHGGNVGIGTTSPQYKLHVNGSFRAASAYIEGTLGFSYNQQSTDIVTQLNILKGLISDSEDNVMNWASDNFLDNVAGTDYVQYISPGSTVSMRLMTVQNTGNYAGNNTPLEIGMQSHNSWARQNAFIRVASSDFGKSWATFTFGSSGQFSCSTASIANLYISKNGNQPYLYASQGQIYFQNPSSYIDGESHLYGFTYHAPSDLRLKNIIRDLTLDVRQIAAMPSVEFAWKRNGKRAVGTIAQPWQGLLPLVVSSDNDGMLSMQYGEAALISVISVARKTCEHESRIQTLERENRELKERLALIEN